MSDQEIAVPEESPEVSPELKAKVETFRAFAEAHNVLAVGHYPATHHLAVAHALKFLKSAFEEARENAAGHKGAWRVPELKEFLEAKKAEAETAKKFKAELEVASKEAEQNAKA